MAAHQAPLSLGFSWQEHWSGLPFPSPMHESEKWKWSRSVVSNPQQPHGLQPTRLLRPWDFPGKSTGVGCHCLLHAVLLGKLKWRKFCSGYRSRRAGLWPASDLPGHCPDSVPACQHSKSGSTLDKKGVVLEFLSYQRSSQPLRV